MVALKQGKGDIIVDDKEFISRLKKILLQAPHVKGMKIFIEKDPQTPAIISLKCAEAIKRSYFAILHIREHDIPEPREDMAFILHRALIKKILEDMGIKISSSGYYFTRIRNLFMIKRVSYIKSGGMYKMNLPRLKDAVVSKYRLYDLVRNNFTEGEVVDRWEHFTDRGRVGGKCVEIVRKG